MGPLPLSPLGKNVVHLAYEAMFVFYAGMYRDMTFDDPNEHLQILSRSWVSSGGEHVQRPTIVT